MHADCIKKVAEAAKRTLSQAKIKAIDEALNAKMRELARQDPQGWQAKSMDQRVAEATKSAMDDISAEGARTEKLAQLQAIKTAETNQRIERAQTMTGRKLSRSQALVRDIENSKDYVDSVRDQSVSTLGAMIDAASNKDGTGMLRNLAMRIWDLDNPQMTRDVVAEVFKQADGHTGNKAAQAGARAWLDTIEAMRVRFNAAGGNVGKLDYGYLSQQHDAAKILRAGPQEWARKVLPLLDRNNYRNADGSLMKDAEVLPMLEKAHTTLSSNGLNKVEPGQFKGSGKRANSGADHRVLHFKDGDAWIAYMQEFGEGSLYDAMLGHVGSMARNIGLVELWGPNPEQNFRVQADIAQRADGVGTKANRALGNTPEAYWNILSGKTGMPENPRIAEAAQAARNIQTAAKLGGAVISSLTDVGTIAHTLHYDRLPYFQMLKNVAKNLDKDHKEFLQAHGVIAEHLTSTLNRWTGDYLTNGLTGRVAQSVMKLSFMNAWTDGLRRAFSATMMQSFAKKVGKDWSKLDEWDRWLMGRKGITEEDWNIISKAKPTEHGGSEYLTRDSIEGVSDADVKAVIAGRLDKIRVSVKDQIDKLQARNDQEGGWLSSRLDKFKAAQDAATKKIGMMVADKDARIQKQSEALQFRVELLQAEIERVRVRSEVESAFQNEKNSDKVRGMLADVHRATNEANEYVPGANSELSRIFEGRADSLAARVAAAGGSIGRQYGLREGALSRRIVELEAKVRTSEQSSDAAIIRADKVEAKRLDGLREEIAEFWNRSEERQSRRQAVMDRLAREEASMLDAEVLTRKQQAATRWMAFVSDESQFAVINPDMATRAIVTGGGMPAGTIRGEAARTFMQFKSFPFAMMTRHWGRIFDTPQGLQGAPTGFGAKTAKGARVNQIAVMAGLNVSLMMLGAVVLQTKAIVQGKDPYDMTDEKFWPRALTQGGGLGYVGDFIFKDPTEQRGSNAEQTYGSVLGPTAGAAAGLAGDLVLTNAWEAAKGKDTHAGAEALRWTTSQLPYVGMWQTRAIFQREFLDHAQEAVNPGYLGRVKARAKKDWNQEFWWEPGERIPNRAPDLSKATGG